MARTKGDEIGHAWLIRIVWAGLAVVSLPAFASDAEERAKALEAAYRSKIPVKVSDQFTLTAAEAVGGHLTLTATGTVQGNMGPAEMEQLRQDFPKSVCRKDGPIPRLAAAGGVTEFVFLLDQGRRIALRLDAKNCVPTQATAFTQAELQKMVDAMQPKLPIKSNENVDIKSITVGEGLRLVYLAEMKNIKSKADAARIRENTELHGNLRQALVAQSCKDAGIETLLNGGVVLVYRYQAHGVELARISFDKSACR